MAKCVLVPLLKKLFYICIKEEIFPEEFKNATLIQFLKYPLPRHLGTYALYIYSQCFQKSLKKF